MAQFSYTAEKNDGEIYKGRAEARDRFELYQTIRREGGHLVSFAEDASSARIWSLAYWNSKITTVPEQEKVLFARNLGSMIAAGLPLTRALSVIERQTSNPRLNVVVAQVASDVRRGDTLNVAIGKSPRVFSKLMVAMVRAGEESGDLSGALITTSDQMQRSLELKKKVRGAMLYPCIILVAIFGIGALLMVKVVPTLASTFGEMHAQLPASTRFIIALSDFLVAHTFSAIVILIVVIGGFYGALKTTRGKRVFEYVILHVPVIGGVVRQVNAARTSRTLASLFASGVDVISALDITADVVQNSYFKEVIAEARSKVGAGEPLSTTFLRAEKLYPPFVGEMMAVGEETGQTSDMLKRLASYYEEEVDRTTKDMSTIIEPFLMIFIGGAVGFFAVSMITPIYQLSQTIN